MTDQERQTKIEEIKVLHAKLSDDLEANRIEHEELKKLQDDVYKASQLLERVKRNKVEKENIEKAIDAVQFQFQQINLS
jgi:hypothetical protein